MKIHIIFKEVDGPWGGGNQFIKALRRALIKQNVYTDNPEESDAILFNSHHNVEKIVEFKSRFPNKLFVHRIDGPVCLVRGTPNMETDHEVFDLNNQFAGMSILQSSWSLNASYLLGFKPVNPVLINNASNKEIFHKNGKSPFNRDKVKVISSSWSSAKNKGLETFQWLDENLDFSRYSYSFVGRVDAEFKNIQKLEPQASDELANTLRSHDIFIAPNINDTFSNAINEAVTCGLPVAYFNSGGNAEVVQQGGIPYNNFEELLKALDVISDNYEVYRSLIKPRDIDDIASQYISAIKKNL